ELLAHWTSVRDIAEGQIAGIADEKARRVTVKRDALQVKLNAIEQRKQEILAEETALQAELAALQDNSEG
ncbi:MAG: hypothetical protein ABIA47_00765, partial [bacterium]